jgi:hypothetical protein
MGPTAQIFIEYPAAGIVLPDGQNCLLDIIGICIRK